MPVDLTMQSFEDTITGNDIVFVDFWAEWCGPCRQFAPVYEAASAEHPDIVFGKVDTEAEQELASMAQITSIPTIMAFREGVLVFAQPGALPAAGLAQVIDGVRSLDMEDVRRQIAAAESGATPNQVDLETFAAEHSQGAMVFDVREPDEYAAGHVPGALSIPLAELPTRAAEIPTDRPVFVICAAGGRSAQAVDFLNSQGATAINVYEGTNGWAAKGWPLEA